MTTATPFFPGFESGDDEPVEPVKAKPRRKRAKAVSPVTKSGQPPEPHQEESPVPSGSEPLTVTELTMQVKGLMETRFREVLVVGQVSNLSLPRSGHVYLTLKDDGAQLPAVLWKSAAARLRFDLDDGMEVVCRGRLDVYPPQGKYQMIVTELEPKGIGALELAFRQLHDKLARAGLFDSRRKKPLPRTIRRVALITSPSGAAIRDFLQVLGRRTRRTDILVVPVRVQGEGAAGEVARAIRDVHRLAAHRPIDCIVVTRGGGSVEDLWAFNEEVLVLAVADSTIPIVSGVGHEVDVTLCDLAADVRALTPSEAAERIAPEDAELSRNLLMIRRRLEDVFEKKIAACRDRIQFIENHPALSRPLRIVEDRRRAVDLQEERLDRVMETRLGANKERLAKAVAALHALSPLAVLARGYSLTETSDGRRIRSVEQVAEGETIRTRLPDGTLESLVKATNLSSMTGVSVTK